MKNRQLGTQLADWEEIIEMGALCNSHRSALLASSCPQDDSGHVGNTLLLELQTSPCQYFMANQQSTSNQLSARGFLPLVGKNPSDEERQSSNASQRCYSQNPTVNIVARWPRLCWIREDEVVHRAEPGNPDVDTGNDRNECLHLILPAHLKWQVVRLGNWG
ncbi:hypothetical protein CISG_05656 [Coccidioides immitis RMSCC 3703]|uniref:Uncharacterized protein n=2 Tax=Coccidioides immitis TaxID=5501 RepID=A0A0J8QZK2_COCIT|nr:hypothetical protein CIRG_00506 [Coccidioides immitis RMSCC 2394]KMU76823.1 hypothetical protein CISG_05656 [Coccidioides immitis RMSCC 3703]